MDILPITSRIFHVNVISCNMWGISMRANAIDVLRYYAVCIEISADAHSKDVITAAIQSIKGVTCFTDSEGERIL